MLSAHLILIDTALLCLLLAALGRPSTSPVSLGWLGMFLWLLSTVVR